MDQNIFFQRWLKGIPYEVAFWRSYYGSQRRRKDLFSWSAYGKTCELDCFDVQQYVASLPSDSVRVIDLGCALSYAMGNRFNCQKSVDVDYVDPLAHFYNRILDRYKISRPRIKFGMIEGISGFYEPNSVDLIHVRNALDHSANPMLGILQAVEILKEGGILYLNHFKNEAVNEGYRGFHQWNITIDNDKLIFWNNEERIDVAARLQEIASVKTAISEEGRIVAIIKKLKSEQKGSAEQIAIRHAVESMMETAMHFHSFSNTLTYQFLRMESTIGHRTMRVMPYSLLRIIKQVMRKKE